MQHWIKIRKDLYRQVLSHVRVLMGSETLAFKRYRSAYENEFKKKWQASDRIELLKKANIAKVLCLGDFHALQQSQKSHLRILNALNKKKQRILAVEFFQAKNQKFLDLFQRGEISEKDFLQAIDWNGTWGFPWEHYKPIVRWAQKNNVQIFGIDQFTSSKSAHSLHSRDKLASQIISSLIEKNSSAQIIVIFGDLHLAPAHLPALVYKKAKLKKEELVTVFQNSESIYFQLLEKGDEHHLDVVKISENKYCLMSVPPWVKWQNYLMYLEQKYDHELDGESADHTDYVSRYAQLIAKELGVQVGSSHFSIYSAESPALWQKLESELAEKDLKWFRSMIENSNSFYIPRIGLGFLARHSVNHAAGLAMAIVYNEISGTEIYPSRMPDDFLKLIWLEAIIYFGSKMINPKRKTDTLIDMKASLATAMPGDLGEEALRLALSQKMNELAYFSQGKKSRNHANSRKLVSYREAARLLGGMLGEKLYNAYSKKIISKFSIIGLLKKPLDSHAENKDFENKYYEIIEIIESLPEPFRSKKEKL